MRTADLQALTEQFTFLKHYTARVFFRSVQYRWVREGDPA